MTVLEEYSQRFANSRPLAERAKGVFPTGVTHDMRMMEPFPIFVDRQQGSQKWDIDGHQFIDYWAGHGSMLLGHSHPNVVTAVQQQMAKGTHAGGSNPLEVEWGALVQQLIPSAERVRFTGSGTEATLMALRLARIYTGRSKFLKFAGHFHGWHDAVTPGADPPYDSMNAPGLTEATLANTIVIPPNNLDLLEQTLRGDADIGAVILEPTGGHWGAVPIRQAFLQGVRELTKKYGQVLIFDEVITGFRVAPGGAQAHWGVLPDLTSMAKILAGGLPGGGLAGKADILGAIEVRPGKPKMRHPGTYNGNPLSAAAGIATLKLIASGEPTRTANELGRQFRNRLNAMFAERGWPCVAYIDFSMFRILMNYTGPRPGAASATDNGFIPYEGDLNKLDGPIDMKLRHAFRQAMLLHGVDLPGFGGWLTCMHTEQDIAATVNAVDQSLARLKHDGLFGK